MGPKLLVQSIEVAFDSDMHYNPATEQSSGQNHH